MSFRLPVNSVFAHPLCMGSSRFRFTAVRFTPLGALGQGRTDIANITTTTDKIHNSLACLGHHIDEALSSSQFRIIIVGHTCLVAFRGVFEGWANPSPGAESSINSRISSTGINSMLFPKGVGGKGKQKMV